MYKKIIICDFCKKEKDKTHRGKWYIEEPKLTVCSRKCFRIKHVQKYFNFKKEVLK